MRIDTSKIRRNSIIELCVVPDVQIHLIMKQMSASFDHPYFFDTIGNLKYVVEDAIEIYSLRKLIRELNKMKAHDSFTLFIDSITIIGDKKDGSSTVFSILWDLVYTNKATIILSNHYQYFVNGSKSYFVPRLGKRFWNLVNYRIFFQYKRNKLSYEIVDNSMLEIKA
ncbi:hypothetical protein NGRA_1698 [Nosema granulosis]|uniref:Uncharacterized protein n=1 Tax=Nosema granulosis TaxID=83296 RepID=A0A9P6KYW7_9MICR|nr:hypothetical protein NGRA_1698 [Nosema granulosis]